MTDAELLAEIEAVVGKPTKGEAFARGAMQGGSLGFADEAAGGVAALASGAQTPFTRTPGPLALARLYPGLPYPEAAQRWFAEHRPDVESAQAAETGRQAAPAAYVAERDKQRGANAQAQAAEPGMYLGGQVAGGLPAAVATGGSGVAGAGGLGIAQGVGYSNADSAGGLARDSAVGLGLGLGGHAVGQALGGAASGVKQFAQNRLGRALARQTAEAAEAKAAAVQSAAGSLGAARAESNRVVEAIRGLLSEPTLTPQQKALLTSLQGTPEYAAALQTLTASLEKRLPEVAGRVAQGEVGLAAAQGGKSVADAAKEGVSGKALWERAIKPRLLRYGPPAVGLAVGSALDAPVLGALAGAGTRPMVRSLIRGLKDPATQTAIWSPVAKAAGAGASQGGRVLTQSLARAGATAGTPSLSGTLSEYLGKSEDDKAAEAELERLLR